MRSTLGALEFWKLPCVALQAWTSISSLQLAKRALPVLVQQIRRHGYLIGLSDGCTMKQDVGPCSKSLEGARHVTTYSSDTTLLCEEEKGNYRKLWSQVAGEEEGTGPAPGTFRPPSASQPQYLARDVWRSSFRP